MIKYNTKTINDWNFDASNIVKVYHNGAVCYYKLEGSPTPTGQTPCYAVVDDITQYSPTEFVDVFDKATEKWYKLNNLNQFEEYGLYGEGLDITYYEGKLTVDNGYEYEYSTNGGWVNRGEVSGSSRVPSGYVELTYAQTSYGNSSSSNAFTVPIDLQETNNYIYEFTPLNWGQNYYGHMLGGNDNSTNFPKLGIFKLDNGWGAETKRFVSAFWNYNLETRRNSPGGNYRVYDNVKSKFTMNLHNYTAGQGADIKVENEGYETVTHTSTTILKSGYSVTSGIYNIDVFSTSNGSSAYIATVQFHNFKVETNEGVPVYDYIPCKRNSDNKVGLYDIVNNAFYSPSAFTLTEGEEVDSFEYPLHYPEMAAPPKELVFDTMEEALAYQCPYVGVIATIGGTLYMFNSGYEWERVEFNITGVTTSSSVFDIQLNMQKESVVIYKDNEDGTYNWGLYYPNPIADATNMCSGNTAMTSFDWGTADTSSLTGLSSSFKDCSGLTSMPSIPSNVTEIGDYTFYECRNMNNGGTIEIPEGVQRIGSNAFNYVFSNSKNLKLPSTLNYVGYSAFMNRSYLSDLYITDLSSFFKIEFADSYNFFNGSMTKFYVNNTQVTDLTIPNDITTLKSFTFLNAVTITSVTIPSTVTSIDGSFTFRYSGLRNVTVPSSVTSWNGSHTFANCRSLTDATLNNKSQISSYAFSNCTSLTGVKFGDKIKTIANNAFSNCTSLTGVTFVDNIKSIGSNVFSGCTNLTSITLNSTTPPSIESDSFEGIPSTCKFYVPCSAVNTYRTASVWSSYASQIVGYESCTVYDWEVVPNEYVCYSHDKYQKTKKICSFDGGTTWEDVTPMEYQRGQLIEASSTDCASSIAVNLNSQWQESTSYGNISDTGNYDFYESFSNKGVNSSTAMMFITINGYTSFTFKVRDYTDKGYDFVVVNNLDDTTIPKWQPTVGTGTASSGWVYYSNKSKSSSTTWYDVTFSNLDGGEHTITITYGKDGIIHENDDRGYVAIPKRQ